MQIGGLQKLTLLDFPGNVACTVFLQGCNFRCPFCHNSALVLGTEAITRESVLAFLKQRQGLLDGVAITGGEPLLSAGLEDFLREIRSLGYKIKLDTNGCFPKRLEQIISAGLADYVAMDIKNAPEKYDLTAGAVGFLPAVRESASLLLDGKISYEIRTTVDELHEPEDFHAIGQWLSGAQQYFLQCFTDSGEILQPGLHAPSKEKLEKCLAIAGQYISNTHIRGI